MYRFLLFMLSVNGEQHTVPARVKWNTGGTQHSSAVKKNRSGRVALRRFPRAVITAVIPCPRKTNADGFGKIIRFPSCKKRENVV